MDLITFWKKTWFIVGWITTIPMIELSKKFKKNKADQKRYFKIKNKIKKGRELSDSENIFYNFYVQNIVW